MRLLVLGAGAAQFGLLAAARERGLFAIAADRDPAAPGFQFADRRAIVSVDDEPLLERLAEAERVHGVIAPGSDLPVGAAARIAARHGLPHPISPETAVLSTSKVRQRERLADAGVPQARWKLVSGPDDELGFPCVVRAPDRGRGASIVRSRKELETAVRAVLQASRNGHCLLEELLEGPEVAVSGFSLGGVFRALTVTDLRSDGSVWPSEHTDAAAALAEHAAAALGIEDGPTFTRIRIGPDGPRAIGLSARIGGGHEAELCRAAVGVELNELALAAALGAEIARDWLELRPQVGGACVRFLVGRPPADGLDEASGVEGVQWVCLHGGRSERAGAVLACGGSGGEALDRAARAAECVRFRTFDAEALV